MFLKKELLFVFGLIVLPSISFSSCLGLGAKQKAEMTGKMMSSLVEVGFTNSTQISTAAAILVCKKGERSFSQMANLLRTQFEELLEHAGAFNIPENMTAAAMLVEANDCACEKQGCSE